LQALSNAKRRPTKIGRRLRVRFAPTKRTGESNRRNDHENQHSTRALEPRALNRGTLSPSDIARVFREGKSLERFVKGA